MSGRSHRTRVGAELSDVAAIVSGVVQGSCLGPVLFLLFINDLPDIFGDTVVSKLYADDVKLYSNVTMMSPYSASDLQDQLNKLTKWAVEWQLPISCTKCCFITIGSSKETSPQSYVINACDLQHVVQVSDLGVTVDSRLKFSIRYDTIEEINVDSKAEYTA